VGLEWGDFAVVCSCFCCCLFLHEVKGVIVGEKWKDFSKALRKYYLNCQWCGKHFSKIRTGYLECHHLGHRGYKSTANPKYRMCPFNIIVVCTDCHLLLEPFSKVRVKLTYENDLGVTWHDEHCCGMGSSCARFRKQRFPANMS
jgi:hypothetical protein